MIEIKRRQWYGCALALVIGVLSWFMFIFTLNPDKSFTEAVGHKQRVGLVFSLAAPVIIWLRLVFLKD